MRKLYIIFDYLSITQPRVYFDVILMLLKPDLPSSSVISLFASESVISSSAKNLSAILKHDDLKLVCSASKFVPGPTVVHSTDNGGFHRLGILIILFS